MNDAPDASQSRISCPGLEQSSDFYQVFLKYFSDAESFNPTRSALLRKFGLALQIERCQGLYLYSPSGLRYLDFLSQYGVLPFGHNHPEIVDAVKDYLNRSRPIMLQPSTPPSVERLADTLQRLAPGKLRFCVFGSSGAEAVEIAVKAARAATGKQTILSTRTGFHGKTLAALSATGRSLYQRPFGGPAPGFEHIAFADPDRLEHYLRRHARETAAFIVEPIQAEGGMIVPGSDYLERVGGACRRNGVLFIADEIQTGLGRTGSLFATLPSASPDILLLSKALGGGIMPISVCMISEAAWTPQIGYLHSSTFANNGLACCVASKVIDMLVRKGEKTINQVRSSGARLLAELQGIQRKYPDVVKDVRGQGLLTGIEFRPFDRGDSAAVAMCAHSECMMGLLSGYLLNEHRLVTAPVFSHSRVLRLQPPLTVSEQQIGKAVDALDSLCENLHKGRYSRLFSYLVRKPSDSPTTSPPRSTGPKAGFRSATAPGGQKGGFAFLIHPSSTEDFLRGDPSFREFSAEELANWHKWAVGMPPSIAHRIPKVESPMGVQTSGWFIGIPLLPKDFYRIGRVAAIGLVEDAIRVAWHLGASVVGLGGYSSIVTRAGLEVTGHGVAVTSGNSLTAVAALRALQRRCRGKRPLSSRSVAVLGAAGSVGRLTATLLAPHVRSLCLIGNPNSLDGQARTIKTAWKAASYLGSAMSEEDLKCSFAANPQLHLDHPGGRLWLEVCQNTAKLPTVDVVVVATNSPMETVQLSDVGKGAIVCDLSLPTNVAAEVRDAPADVTLIDGRKLLQLPHEIPLGPIEEKEGRSVLGCLAETILIALEGAAKPGEEVPNLSIGDDLDVGGALQLERLAKRHGFCFA